jgi:hypothetical protein
MIGQVCCTVLLDYAHEDGSRRALNRAGLPFYQIITRTGIAMPRASLSAAT